MRRAINSATSPADLQARLNSAGGPSLSLANLATPFPVLRPKLLASLEQAKLNALEQFSSSKPSMIWSLLQRCFHVILSAVGYGLGFAASAQRPDSELTVLQEWKRALNKRKRQAVSMQTLLNERESWLGLRNGRQEVLIKLSSRDHALLRRKLRILRIKLYHKNSRGRRNRAMIQKPGLSQIPLRSVECLGRARFEAIPFGHVALLNGIRGMAEAADRLVDLQGAEHEGHARAGQVHEHRQDGDQPQRPEKAHEHGFHPVLQGGLRRWPPDGGCQPWRDGL